MNFNVIKIINKEDRSGQFTCVKVAKNVAGDTSFDDYTQAEYFSEKLDNCHVVLEEDFQPWITAAKLVQNTVKAKLGIVSVK